MIKNIKDSDEVKLYDQALSRFQAKFDKLIESKNFQAGSQLTSIQATESPSSMPASPPRVFLSIWSEAEVL